ncbi:hypothetical protein BOTCAL_0603g00060 [Botryotinia calthae]|uniref:Uncharacterized protein n=1 Tax=Botryotinia calthae TaxID=38488 RepID=A0A4Y8CJM9_9HELO|nr:hypothetical protein BOTCAL_0603g00060 [Botryotinia calthae]
MDVQTSFHSHPAPSSFQLTGEYQNITPHPNHDNDSEAQYFLDTAKPLQPEKSSAVIQQRPSRDSNGAFELENHKSHHWWRPIALMVMWLLLGSSVGLGHHFAYQSFDQQPQTVFSQSWAHNLGSGAAFLVKTSFTLTILLALQEVLWFSFRRRDIKISLIDKLFTLSSNPFSFVPSAFVNAPLATALAAFAWTIPISAILSPGSLVVGPMVTFNEGICTVPTFAASSPNISFYQMIPHGSGIQGPNTGIQKLASQIFAQGIILNIESPCGNNCSFQHSFYGPALQCVNTSNPSYLNEQVASYLYYNATDLTTFSESEDSLIELSVTYRNNTKAEVQSDLNYVSILCTAYNATYELSVNYTNGLPKFSPSLTYHEQLQNLNMTEYVSPGNYPWHSNSATLVREVYDKHLNGTWAQSPTAQYSTPNTNIGNTILVGNTVNANSGAITSLWFVNRDLLTGIPELLTNLTISTLAFSPENTSTSCLSSKETLVYYYNPNLLLIPYSIAFCLGLVSFLAGVFVLIQTGIRTGDIFSQILVTTRNPFLDEIARGHSLGSADADVMKDHKLRLGKLKRLHGENGDYSDGDYGRRAEHAAFGLAEQVNSLR